MPSCPTCGFELPDDGLCLRCHPQRSAPRSRSRPTNRRGVSGGAFLTRYRLSLVAVAFLLILGLAAGYFALLPRLAANAMVYSAPSPSVAEPSTSALAPGDSPPSDPIASAAAGETKPRESASLPTGSRKAYMDWMLAHTAETGPLLGKKWARAQVLLANKNIVTEPVLKAFLYTPREFFARRYNLKKAYDNTALPIGYGQTISGPHMVVSMTESIKPTREDRILEIGTGSGYQSALLSELCDHVYTIEIVPPLYRETDLVYAKLLGKYPEYASVMRASGDGYYGWAKYAPFQKIIVTAGIDHIPPPLLRQLAPNGIMVIPVGPPSGQTVLRIVKRPLPGGGFAFDRSDIFSGRKVIFVPFTTTGGSRHQAGDPAIGTDK